MKDLNTSSIAANSAALGDKATFEHLNNMSKEIGSSLAKSLIEGYVEDTIYALHGCVTTKDGNDYTCTSGSIFYNGEIYQITAAVFNTANRGCFYIITSPGLKTFTDNAVKSWLRDKTIVLMPDDATGNEIGVWNDVVYDLQRDYIEQSNEASNNICDINLVAGVSIDLLRLSAVKKNGVIQISGKVTVNVDSDAGGITTPNSITLNMLLKPKYRPKDDNFGFQFGVGQNYRVVPGGGGALNTLTLPEVYLETNTVVVILNNNGWEPTFVTNEKVTCTFAINFV